MKAQRCVAHRKNGDPCKNHAILGATVCRVHGGSAPQVQRKAAERIAEVRDDALALLKVQIQAKKDVSPNLALTIVRELSELGETLEGRVARREGVNVDAGDGLRDILADRIARVARVRGTDGDIGGSD